jgi:hypothetical protein
MIAERTDDVNDAGIASYPSARTVPYLPCER